MSNAKRPKRSRSKTMFYDLFIGEYVEIVTKTTIAVAESTPDGVITQTTPLVFNGYIIDIDDTWIYLGPEAFMVSQGVKKDELVSISVTEKQEEPTMPKDKNLN